MLNLHDYKVIVNWTEVKDLCEAFIRFDTILHCLRKKV